MMLLLLMVFNGFILFYATVVGASFLKQPLTNFDLFACGTIAFFVVCGLAFLFHSPLGQWFLRFSSGARKMIERESQQLNPLIEQVQAAVQIKHGLAPLKLQVMVTDDPMPDAFAIGKNTMVVSRALYETATPDELAAVIAHELGHLHHGDSNKLGIALGVSTVTLVISFLASMVVTLASFVSKVSPKNEGGIFFHILSFIAMVFSAFFLLFVWLGNGILKLAMLFVGRKQEYRADQFAVHAGFGAGLLSFLEKVKNFEWASKQSFMAKLYATHPPVMLRIGELEKLTN